MRRRRWRWAWGGGLAAGLAFAASWMAPESGPPAPLPAVLADEPDVYMEAPIITRFDAAGAIRYRLVAAEIRQFHGDGLTTLDAPVLHLEGGAEAAPWRVAGATGELRRTPPGAGADEELSLREAVELRRGHRGGPGFFKLQTSLLHVYPERQYARTERPVIIETASGRMTAAAFEGELERGWLKLKATPSQRVQIVVLPDRIGRRPAA